MREDKGRRNSKCLKEARESTKEVKAVHKGRLDKWRPDDIEQILCSIAQHSIGIEATTQDESLQYTRGESCVYKWRGEVSTEQSRGGKVTVNTSYMT